MKRKRAKRSKASGERVVGPIAAERNESERDGNRRYLRRYELDDQFVYRNDDDGGPEVLFGLSGTI